MSAPAAYISYAWGDDKSDAGLEREAIVDDLCQSFAEVGLVIGRDKNEVKCGDSIEAFGLRIAKAPVIVAVVSEKSLKSQWCMLYELHEAYKRRGEDAIEFANDVVALVLDDAQPYLDDLKKQRQLVDYWQGWCKDFEDLLNTADPGTEKSFGPREVLSKCKDMIKSLPEMLSAIKGIAMPRGSAAIRREDFKEIREYVKSKLPTPLSLGMSALPTDEKGTSAPSVSQRLGSADAVALVLTPSGEENAAVRWFQWKAIVQRSGEPEYREIPSGAIGVAPSLAKEKLPGLLQSLKSWIDTEFEDVLVLEIFVPNDLLDEDWGSINVLSSDDPKPLHTYQPYLLRSSDRLLNRGWNGRRGALIRMHNHLVQGDGAWLPQDQINKGDLIETLDGEALVPEPGGHVIAAIRCLQATSLTNRATWLKSVLMSMAPLVVWPSRKSSLTEEQVKECLSKLGLTREDTSPGGKVDRPTCPDLVTLAKARRRWILNTIELRGLTILVDHPDRGPDRKMLQALFAPTRAAPSCTPQVEGSDHPAQLLISPG